jgi:hypothetical protein
VNIEVSDAEFIDPRYGKVKRPYVAVIKGPGQEYALDRSFTKVKPVDGAIALPKRDGVYEVRDYPDQKARTRYFQVMGAAVREMQTLGDDDVLEAVAFAQNAVWHTSTDVPAEQGVASTSDVLEVIDQAEVDLVKLSVEGSFDEEDIAMVVDKIRRVVERL